MRQAGVYTILNLVTGRCYVGSSINVAQRWGYHLSKLNTGKHSNGALQTDWATYGADAFAWSLVEPCDTRSTLIVREQYHIDTTPDRYNIATRAGDRIREGFTHYPESIRRMSEAAKGHTRNTGKPWSARRRALWDAKRAAGGFQHTAESRARMSVAIRAALERQPRVGVIPSEQTRQKMSAKQKGRIITAEARAKLSATRKARGIVMSDASRAQWRATRAGYTHSQETRAKMAAAHQRRRAMKESA